MSIIYPLIYFLLVISPLGLILLSGPVTDHHFTYELGKAFALMGVVIITLQFILSSRPKWLDRVYGLDMLFSFHKAMAVLAGLLIASHPILLAFGSGHLDLLFSLSQPWYILVGKAALLLALIQVLISLFRKKISLKFDKWRPVHNIVGGTLFVGIFVHSLNAAGTTDLGLFALQTEWGILVIGGLAFYGVHKMIIPWQAKKNAYTVSEVKQEVHNVWTLAFKPPEAKKRYDYLPGQFHFINLHRNRDLPHEEHHFTISSSPSMEGHVTSTIKESGDYTKTIKETKVGDKVSIEAPFGRFSHVFHPEHRKMVFIAGGIGITPLMANLRHMRDTQADKEILLIYANHAQKDIVFRKELDEMVAGQVPKLNVVHILDDPEEDWDGEKGVVDEAFLKRTLTDFKQSFYICTPPPMRTVVLDILKKNGVKANQIVQEVFEL